MAIESKSKEMRELALQKSKQGKISWIWLDDYISELSFKNHYLADFMRRLEKPKKLFPRNNPRLAFKLDTEESLVASITDNVVIYLFRMTTIQDSMSGPFSPMARAMNPVEIDHYYFFAMQVENNELILNYNYDIRDNQQAALVELVEIALSTANQKLIDQGLAKLSEL